MSEIEVEKVTLDKLSIFKNLIFRLSRNFALIIPKKNFNSFFDDSYTLEQLEKGVADLESDVHFVLVDGRLHRLNMT